MPLTAEQRRDRGRLAANARHHPDEPERTAAERADADARRLGRAVADIADIGDREDEEIRAIVARAPTMTAEQAGRLGRMFAYIDPAAGG